MEKSAVVESLGQNALLEPTWIALALKANDRLKLCLLLLQAAAEHARHPDRSVHDLQREIDAAAIAPVELARWLRDLPALAEQHAAGMELPGWPRLAALLRDDVQAMARPLAVAAEGLDAEIAARVQHWSDWLGSRSTSDVSWEDVDALTRGDRGQGDGLHILVMDLHQRINRLVSRLAVESVDGAQVWGLADADKTLVRAFMRGLQRTAALELDHPGLDTVATRDGGRLLIQNDIGTSDVHVLVLAVDGLRLTMTYSDLHPERFAFFQHILADTGLQWSVATRESADMNAGARYQVGTATVDAADAAALELVLERIGARIVFLIDWNRARKRLQQFVDKPHAVALLGAAAREEVGHMPWLATGGERLVWEAMAAQEAEVFRLGDRLDAVLGEDDAAQFLLQLLRLSTQAVRQHQPVALVGDEARLLLARMLRSHSASFALLADHAAYAQGLAEALAAALERGLERDPAAAAALATRAKIWERRADHLVMQARDRALRGPQWREFAALLERADDAVDAIEEAVFLFSLLAESHAAVWSDAVRAALSALARTVADAAKDQVRLVTVLAALDGASDASDQEKFVAASWRVLQAERRCDELLRAARRALCRDVRDPAGLMLATDFAAAVELASDVLLAQAYALREQGFARSRRFG